MVKTRLTTGPIRVAPLGHEEDWISSSLAPILLAPPRSLQIFWTWALITVQFGPPFNSDEESQDARDAKRLLVAGLRYLMQMASQAATATT